MPFDVHQNELNVTDVELKRHLDSLELFWARAHLDLSSILVSCLLKLEENYYLEIVTFKIQEKKKLYSDAEFDNSDSDEFQDMVN